MMYYTMPNFTLIGIHYRSFCRKTAKTVIFSKFVTSLLYPLIFPDQGQMEHAYYVMLNFSVIGKYGSLYGAKKRKFDQFLNIEEGAPLPRGAGGFR